uniref:RRM domain-containing protein n=1 Tax=Catagonus wagneri TaxID=51154 RepID=A0A8C3WHG8_9CETA
PQTPKHYAQPGVPRRAFEVLSDLYQLLPNRLMELLRSHKTEEDEKKCENSELSGLERILERHQFPKEIFLTPKPSSMPPWRRKANNTENQGWKKCHLWNKATQEPPMSTIVVRWLKKNMQPAEDLDSVARRLAVFGPIKSVTLCGRQSAVVAFEDTVSACHAVAAFQGRVPGTMFQCAWQQPFMAKDVSLPRPHPHPPQSPSLAPSQRGSGQREPSTHPPVSAGNRPDEDRLVREREIRNCSRAIPGHGLRAAAGVTASPSWTGRRRWRRGTPPTPTFPAGLGSPPRSRRAAAPSPDF